MSTWILVGDASRADLYHTDGRERDWQLVKHFEHEESRLPDRALSPTAPGHSAKSKGSARRTAFEAKTSPHETEKARFAAELMDYLRHAVDERAFEHLWIFAAPHFLGLLRGMLTREIEQRLAGTADHDYHFASERDARQRLSSIIFS